MQEKYNVTGMTCAACQARVQKSVSNLTGVQECNVNLLKNSMVVTYDDKNVNSGQIIAAVEKAGYGASIQQVKGKSAAQAVSPVDTVKKEYETMKRRVIWSFVFTIPLFYICNELFTWADVYDTANHDERRAILQQFIKEIRVRKDYEISITLNASLDVRIKEGGFPLGGSCQRLRPLTDEGQPCQIGRAHV